MHAKILLKFKEIGIAISDKEMQVRTEVKLDGYLVTQKEWSWIPKKSSSFGSFQSQPM